MLATLKAIARYAKAIAAGVAALGLTLNDALGDDHITGKEWIGIVLAVLAASGLVGGIPNAKGRRR